MARQIGQDTPFPSLEVATEDFTGYVGACSPGFNCSYMNTISWSSPTTPLPMDINPAGGLRADVRPGRHGGAAAGADARRAQHARFDRPGSAIRCSAASGTRDRVRVGEYLDNLREIERRIQRTEAHNNAEVTLDAPIGVPDSFEEHVALMYDLLAVAYQADVTRVFTFMTVARAQSADLSRRSASPNSTTPCRITATTRTRSPRTSRSTPTSSRMFARFLEKLRSTPDGDGTLLDHSMIFYGGGMGNPNGHLSDPLPVIVAGGGVGRGHRHIKLPERTPGRPTCG